ncbi:MAG: competence protein ComEC [Flavobacteriales bacterium]|jgi:competence protein ComEC
MLNLAITNPLRDSMHYVERMDGQEHRLIFEVQEQLKPTAFQNKYIVHLKRCNGNPATGKLLLNIGKDSSQALLKVGQHLFTRAIIQEVPHPKSPYQFDYGAYLNNQHIYGQVSVQTDELQSLRQGSNGIKVWAARFRESVQRSLQEQSFSTRQLSVINALLLGQRQGIDRQLNQQYAAAGVIHILAVSGLHVGIILWLLRGITTPLSRYRWRHLRSILIVLCIWAFAFITGGSPSVLRAATMFSFLEMGRAVGGQSNTFNSLMYSALFLVLLNPLQLYQVGFQLSYLAVMAILWIQPWLSRLYVPKYRLTKLLWDTTTVTVAAQLGVMPLSLFYFHQFPGLFLVSNLVILPMLGILLGSGIGIIVLSYFQILPDGIASGYGAVIDTLNTYIGWVAAQESFVFKHLSISTLEMLVMYLSIGSGVYLFQRYEYRRLLFFLSAIMVSLGILTYQKATPEPAHFVIFQQSRATLIGTYANRQLHVFSNDTTYDYNIDYKVNNYKDQLSLKAVSRDSLPSLFRFKRKTILRVDSLGIYTVPGLHPDIIILTQSPNINLHRLIDQYPNVQIIGDGSNYRSDIIRWKATCLERKIPFHSTYEKGAFILK